MGEHGEDHLGGKEKRDSNPEASDRENDNFEDAIATPAEEEHVTSPTASTRSLTHHAPAIPAEPDLETPVNGIEEKEKKEEAEEKGKGGEHGHASHPNSPLLTTHRLSATSLDNVDLEEESIDPKKKEASKPALPKRSSDKPTLQGLSGALPSVPWSPPPPPPQNAKSVAAPPPPTRKITSPFSWLSRGTTATKEPVASTPPTAGGDRRNTASSITTIGSNPDMMLNKLEEGGDADGSGRHPARNSLKDRFKLLRMREEAGITPVGDDEASGGAIAGLITRSTTFGLGVASPTVADEVPHSTMPTSPNPSSFNPSLAPGTAAGVSAGPSASTEAVDWDLWQSVVYEGPAAVARTSPEELNRAIATGIPSAIRGVVWQVLAQSKNDELESVYRDLLSRGTDQDRDRMSGLSSGSGGKEKDTTASSSSSVHSDNSILPTGGNNPLRSPSPSHERDADSIAKAQAAAMVERRRKAKEDAAALQKLEKTIRRDLGARTSFSKFAASAGLQDGLFGVCKAYALFDEGVGYAQGMNFLAMPLLFNMPEEEAFCLLVRLMNQYHLRDLFIDGMPGLHMHLYQFERLLEDLEPALYCHLHRKQVTPHLYATQWFLTLFAYRFPLQLVLRIYDLILSEGLEAILKFGIVLMQKNAAALLAMNDMVALTTFLKDRLFDVYIDSSPSAGSILESGFFGSSGATIDKEVYRADTLVENACATKITPEMLKMYTAEWEEKTKTEAAREAELDALKTANATLNIKVRRLEERVQEHDTEHAALATDLVRTKVENEELKDKNESMKGQILELRKVVEHQPAEVEERLKSEMDRLLKRNQEVHEENTRLEEEMGEMEQALVETKMQYAEINAQHEALSRRWTDLRKALD